jgi:hypothetical protein
MREVGNIPGILTLLGKVPHPATRTLLLVSQEGTQVRCPFSWAYYRTLAAVSPRNEEKTTN